MCAWDFCMWVIFEKQMYCWPRSLCSGVENKLLILLSELIQSNHNQLFKCWKWAFFDKKIYKMQKDSQIQNSVKTDVNIHIDFISRFSACYGGRPPHERFLNLWCGVTLTFKGSDVNIRANFVSRFSACFSGRPCRRFSDLRFWVTLTFKLTGGFWHKLA